MRLTFFKTTHTHTPTRGEHRFHKSLSVLPLTTNNDTQRAGLCGRGGAYNGN